MRRPPPTPCGRGVLITALEGPREKSEPMEGNEREIWLCVFFLSFHKFEVPVR